MFGYESRTTLETVALEADHRDWRAESTDEDNTKTIMKRDEQRWTLFRVTTWKLSFRIRAEKRCGREYEPRR